MAAIARDTHHEEAELVCLRKCQRKGKIKKKWITVMVLFFFFS